MTESRERIRAGPDVLQLPLLGSDEAGSVPPSLRTKARHRPAFDEDEDVALQLWLDLPLGAGEEEYVWAEEDIETLREGVLSDALRTILDDRNGEALRSEIWEWIYSDEPLPFSFNVCARTAGVDPEELRATFERMVARLGKAAREAA